MSLFDTLKQLFSKEALKYIYLPVPRDHVKDAQYADGALQAGKHYFRLWLAEMFLKKEVDWFRTWYPMAHSLVVFQFGQQTIEIPHVAGGAKLQGLSEADLSRVIQLNHPMTALIPYNGGVIELVTALVAMKGADSMAAVVKVMGDLSATLVSPQLSSVLNMALPIASGVQDLVGGGNGAIHLGVHQSFTGEGGGGANLLRPGYIAVIRGSQREYPPERLWIANDQLRIGATQESSEPLTGVTYMLFRIEARAERDDWTGLKDISDSFKEALKYLGESDEEKAKLAFNRAAMLARMSPDLTRADRGRVALALKEEFEEARNSGLGAVPTADRALEGIIGRRAISVDEALANEPSLFALLSS
jgi:hypothetical protein